jgi:hypothetical protein
MKNNIIFLVLLCHLLSVPNITQAQKNKQLVIDIKESYDKFYARTDSLHKAQPNFTFNDTIVNDLKNIDTTEPYNFFWRAMDKYEYELGTFDEAAIYYYVGLIRYHYYLGVNPGYPPSGGWVTTESLRQRVTKRIELYSQTNINKYIYVLKYAINYCNSNNYNYWTKPKDELMLKKVLEPYESLLKDLQTNKEKYITQWQADRDKNLNPKSLSRDEIRKKMEENMAAKVGSIYKLMTEAQELKAKIKQEENNDSSINRIQNQKRLDEVEKIVIDYANESTQRKIVLLNKELEDLIANNDTAKVLFLKAQKSINVDTAKSKTDIYNFYDEQKRINHYKYIKSKEKIAILDYLNKKNWPENKKIAVLKLAYDESDTSKIIDRTEDIYLTKIELKKMELEKFQNILKQNNKKQEARVRIKQLVGETEGRKVWDDIENIINDYQKQYTAH